MRPTEIDPLLVPYWQARDEEEAQRIAAQLLAEQLTPIIRGIVGRKLGVWLSLRREEAADVQGEIILQLLHRLRQFRQDNHDAPIKNLRAYVAVASYRGCAAYLRQRYPNRWRLLNRVRYLLTSQPQFVLRQDEHEEWLGGLASWGQQQRGYQPLSQERMQCLVEGPLPPQLNGFPDPTFTRFGPVAQLEALFQWLAQFIALDELVAILAHWWDIKDQTTSNLQERSDPRANPEDQVGQRLYLQKLWQEITALPVRQRQALLLNLRDLGNHSVITLLPALQIINLRGIAKVLELPAEEFAEVWTRLPLDDAEIANRLQVTRRQVINLRKAARERLLRRTRNW